MEFEQKYTEGSDEPLLFQVEEGLIDDLMDSALTTDQAQAVANMLEHNASDIPSGKGTLVCGGLVTGDEDRFFNVEYVKDPGGIPTYFRYSDGEVDNYLDHILDNTLLINHDED